MAEETKEVRMGTPLTIIATKVCTKWEHKLPLRSCFVCYRRKVEEESVKNI